MTNDQSPQLRDRLNRIRLLLLDVDGVLTDGKIIYDDQGHEIKAFNVKDGLGVRLLMKAGIPVGIVTGRSSRALDHRCRNLGIEYVFDGIRDKGAVLDRITEQTGARPQEIAFMGDDLPDLPLMARVGLPIAVADAHDLVVKKAAVVTSRPGGHGAVREICEAILMAKGLWEETIGSWLTAGAAPS